LSVIVGGESLVSHAGGSLLVATAGVAGLSREVTTCLGRWSTGGDPRSTLAAVPREVVVGLSGTAVADGGAGALAELGARFLNVENREVTPRRTRCPVSSEWIWNPRRLSAGVRVLLLSDVRTPVADDLASFATQKGSTKHTRPVSAAALHHLVDLLADAGMQGMHESFHTPWLGAGGGIRSGLYSVGGPRPVLERKDYSIWTPTT
jgi:glycerate kinase